MVGAEAAVGPGPERGIFREVIPILAQRHTFWELRHSHLVPVFSKSISSPDPDRLQWFWAFGVFQALHLALFRQGAYNCSFALATAFILGEPGMLMTQDYVHAMDPKLGNALDPWFALQAEDPMPTSPSHPLVQLIANVLDMQVRYLPFKFVVCNYLLFYLKPSIIPHVRSQDQHDAWTRTIVQAAALGPADIWHHPEFLAMRHGFNIELTTNPNGPRFINVSIHLPRLASIHLSRFRVSITQA